MSQVANIDRTVSDVGTLVHANYVNEVKPLLMHISPLAALFSEMGPGGYTLDGSGTQLEGALDDKFSGGFMGTDGYLPDHQDVRPFRWTTNPARLYARRAIDNMMAVVAKEPGAFEPLVDRITDQMLDAVDRGTSFHIHGGAAATVGTFVSRTSATVLVIDAGHGHAGQDPSLFIEQGSVLSLLDASSAYATIGSAIVDSIARNTPSTGQATVTFASSIDAGATGADGDPIVFATTPDESASYYVTERNRAPNGLLDMIDPDNSLSAFMGVTEASNPRFNPIRTASVDFGHIEVMEFLAELAARSNSNVNSTTHVITCQDGVKIELARDLIPFQQQQALGRTLQGGWQTVKVGDFEILADNYHLWDIMYFIDPEAVHVIDLDGQPAVWAGDGNQYSRLADYDGKEWFLRHYVQRITTLRNRLGALTGVPNPNRQRYLPIPQ